jgi:hypothetical protein
VDYLDYLVDLCGMMEYKTLWSDLVKVVGDLAGLPS